VVIPIHDENPTRRFAWLTLLLIVANIAIFAFVQPHQRPVDDARFTYEHAAIPCELSQGEPLTVAEANTGRCGADARSPELSPDRELFAHKNVWLAVLYSMFLHGSWFHVLGNMLFLWIFGNNIEDHLGRLAFIAFYLVTGVVAAGAHVLAEPSSTIPFVGASGAIAGIMGAYLVFWPRAQILSVVPFFFFIPMYISARFYLLIWFGVQFLTDPNSGIAWVAHVGGFVAGAVIAMLVRAIYGPPPQPVVHPRTRPRW
jgi:membrane associated rhomboid family serine protease